MTLHTKIKTGLFAAIIAFGMFGASAFAEMDTDMLRAEITALKQEHRDLSAQVDSGELTKEEAHEMWVEKIEGLRELKEQVFAEKIEKIQERYEKALQINPERAEAIKEFMSNMTEKRDQMREQKEALRTAVDSGELTKEEARSQMKEMHMDARDAREGFRENFAEKRSEFKAYRMKMMENDKGTRQMRDAE